MTVLRSLLFVPGNRADMLAKATALTPDAFVPDMEDSVPVEEKTNARNITASFVPQLAQGGALVIPRVNSLDTGLLAEDLAAVVGPHIYGVSVGKIYTPQDVETISDILARLELKAGVPMATPNSFSGWRRPWPLCMRTPSVPRLHGLWGRPLVLKI